MNFYKDIVEITIQLDSILNHSGISKIDLYDSYRLLLNIIKHIEILIDNRCLLFKYDEPLLPSNTKGITYAKCISLLNKDFTDIDIYVKEYILLVNKMSSNEKYFDNIIKGYYCTPIILYDSFSLEYQTINQTSNTILKKELCVLDSLEKKRKFKEHLIDIKSKLEISSCKIKKYILDHYTISELV
ncbi:MAG: hypothetical protein U9Q04_08995 [Campylobacterota bacterium]|nr:hypothetical protein [Campylobacterota bacterium]